MSAVAAVEEPSQADGEVWTKFSWPSKTGSDRNSSDHIRRSRSPGCRGVRCRRSIWTQRPFWTRAHWGLIRKGRRHPGYARAPAACRVGVSSWVRRGEKKVQGRDGIVLALAHRGPV